MSSHLPAVLCRPAIMPIFIVLCVLGRPVIYGVLCVLCAGRSRGLLGLLCIKFVLCVRRTLVPLGVVGWCDGAG